MGDPPDNSFKNAYKRLSKTVIFDSKNCSNDEMKELLYHSQDPHFVPHVMPYEGSVRKLGNSCGFTIPKNVAADRGLKIGDEVRLILMPPAERLSTIPRKYSKEDIDAIYEKYPQYFKISENGRLSDIDFEQVGRKFHIPIYTPVGRSGSSPALIIALPVLQLFGFDIGNKANIIIQKVYI